MRRRPESVSRRRVLAVLATGGSVAVAGCSGGGGGGATAGDGSGDSSGDGTSGGDGGDGGSSGPPSATFSFNYKSDVGRYVVTHKGGETINTDNTGLLAVDEYVNGERQDQTRRVWFTSRGDPVEPGDTETGTVGEDLTKVKVNWGPPGCEGDCVGSLTALAEWSPPSR